MLTISNPDDPRIDVYRELKIVNRQRQQECFIVEGGLLVERLLASRYPTLSILCIERFADQWTSLAPSHVPVYVVPDDWISQLVGFRFHRGVLACGARLPPRTLGDMAGTAEIATYVVCPHVQDPENLGSILRVSAAFGVDGVLAGSQCPDYLSRRVLRVSMGSALVLPIRVSHDIAEDLRVLRDQHHSELVATVLSEHAESLEVFQRNKRLALLMGREDRGLDAQLLELCQRHVTIPMQLGTDSLNVAVAAGLFLFHLNGARYRDAAM
jgi:tRNA G18 (ribose-2'-O)-methylase SpoU